MRGRIYDVGTQMTNYTFGCSFTKWYWPTWSDWMGVYGHQTQNLAYPGYNNKLIYWMLIDRLDTITTADHVYIMWSENNRIPQWYDNEWVIKNDCKGFFPDNNGELWFGSEAYTGLYRTHPEHQFSQTHNIVNLFNIIFDTQQLLKSRNINYTMMFMCNPWADSRPTHGKRFITNWGNKDTLSVADIKLADSILKIRPVRHILTMIDWTTFVEAVDIMQPTSYTGLMEYYLGKRELVLLAHESDSHPNPLAHHEYLVEKILKIHASTDVQTRALNISYDVMNMKIPEWGVDDFIGLPDAILLRSPI